MQVTYCYCTKLKFFCVEVEVEVEVEPYKRTLHKGGVRFPAKN